MDKYVGRRNQSEYLSKNNVPAAVQLLLEKLDHPNEHSVLKAVDSLGNLGEMAAPALPRLIMLFLGQSIYLRNVVARTLGQIGEPALEALLPCLSDPRADVRLQTARVLGWIGRDAIGANDELMRRLGDPNQAVREAILTALDRINE
ncbi:MAG: HEAT repeat domain-containing protein [Chloroflexi bacterium]|nr:HEAT repeat domain-containing protein [Chloroflexota bacterium]